MITKFSDFVEALHNAGFSLAGGGDDGIYSIISWGWNEAPPYETPIKWHTGCPETDPWVWRMRVLEECDDIAYGKLFFKKSGFITKEWYPYFLAVRRGSYGFDDAYESGVISNAAKRVYDVVMREGILPSHIIKHMAGFSKEDKAVFERALVELQMRMYISACGEQTKISKNGDEYAWPSSMFCTTESYFDSSVFEQAAAITEEDATKKITEQVLKLNPAAKASKIAKFIRG